MKEIRDIIGGVFYCFSNKLAIDWVREKECMEKEMTNDFIPISIDTRKKHWLHHSFPSKFGNALEKVMREFAIYSYGEENVPVVYNPHGLDFTELKGITGNSDRQWLVSSLEETDVKDKAKDFYLRHKRDGNKVTSSMMCELLHEEKGTVAKSKKPTDLLFIDDKGVLNFFEIKAFDNLDSSSAPANVHKLLEEYVMANTMYANAQLGVTRQMFIKGNGRFGMYVGRDCMLFAEELWQKVLPSVPVATTRRLIQEGMIATGLNEYDKLLEFC